ncbi:T9SS type A sorting domain-containing protein [Labilibacter marinus]|uniref:T9SS type A sorting domain-containing protein n=1 Tax=Labilibacter marinus TaxID=1477105 RepID=UPI00094F769C|nr:T9SS type A sorting domain-containing protein [Labilibacter marinus]
MKATLLLCIAFFISTSAISQLSIDQTGANYTIDFDNSVSGINDGAFAGSGFTPTPSTGQLNSNGIIATGLSDGDINFGDSNETADFARGTSNGGIGTGGIYSFETTTNNFALGIQPIGSDFTPGSFIIKIFNNTGQEINAITLSYDILVYNDQNRANSFNLAYSTDNNSYTNISDLDYTSPEAANGSPSWIMTNKNTTISETISDGGLMYLKWNSDDVSGSGSRDEFALDNIIVNASLSNNIKNVEHPLKVYPTPFNNHLTIKGNNIESVTLIDLTGKTILQREKISATEMILPTSQLSNGIYLVRIAKYNGTIITKKVMKK